MNYSLIFYILAILLFLIAGFGVARGDSRFSITDLGLASLAIALFLTGR